MQTQELQELNAQAADYLVRWQGQELINRRVTGISESCGIVLGGLLDRAVGEFLTINLRVSRESANNGGNVEALIVKFSSANDDEGFGFRSTSIDRANGNGMRIRVYPGRQFLGVAAGGGELSALFTPQEITELTFENFP